uniref:Clathrin/coatomer adaptor adaptin-like N-terminal domain-containing protein n=1 Tax=Timema poppense TaxID=170557 RepID=A0A7R9GXB0_TIMPO|nr:unnamed protein product [Timema poppensis]
MVFPQLIANAIFLSPYYFSSHPPVNENNTKIFVWNCALHSASDMVFDCCAHAHIGGGGEEGRTASMATLMRPFHTLLFAADSNQFESVATLKVRLVKVLSANAMSISFVVLLASIGVAFLYYALIYYFSSHTPLYEKDKKIFVWNCALHSTSDVVFDCCAHAHIGGWEGRHDCRVERALLLLQVPALARWWKELIEAVHIYKDLSCLIGPVVKLLPSHNEEVKKASYKVLPKICASHPEIAVLVVNTIKKDCNDPNPVVKCLAVSTLCSLLPLIEEHATHVLGVAIDDDNPNVRQTAVLGCVQVFKSIPLLLQEQGFIDRLYSCIRDIDPRVVTSSLLALDTILAHEGGVVVNKSITFHLLQRLGEFPNSLLATVLQVLKKYKPCEENERFQELSVLDQYLTQSSSAAVTVNCVELFLSLTEEHHQHLHSEIIQQVVPVFKKFILPQASKESTNYVLDFLFKIKRRNLQWLVAFEDSPELFYPCDKPRDVTISLKKLKLLPYICSQKNSMGVLEVLKRIYCTKTFISNATISCICLISSCQPSLSTECLSIMFILLKSTNPNIRHQVLENLVDFNFDAVEKESIHLLLKQVIKFVDLSSKDIPNIVLLLVGECGEKANEDTLFVLEIMCTNFLLYDDEKTQSLILTTTVKMFLKMPAQYQKILGCVMEKCFDKSKKCEVSVSLQHKVLKYYKLLHSNINILKKIIL